MPDREPMPGRAHHGLPRLLAGLDPGAGAMTLAEHERVHGPLPAGGPALIDEVARSGLRGRGGADFPTAVKLEAVARRRRASAVVVNAGETEPASAKDRLLLTRLPHLVLDGAVLAAEACGAREVIVKLAAEAVMSIDAVEQAIAARSGDGLGIRVVAGPGGYVSGEESAVIQQLNGGPALPTLVPPRPYERGYRGRPTLVQNAETLAQIALIARFGAGWFRELGTEADPGSALVTISGAVAEPGVYELAFGTAMTDLLGAAGGPTEQLRALLVGGYFGTWVEVSRAVNLRLAREDLRTVGCSLGSGDGVAALAAGTASDAERERLLRWTREVRGRGACHHPDGAVRFVQSSLEVFADEVQAHRRGRCVELAAASAPASRAGSLW
jgi:NADH:ubiquinone oxidoreductase subunit F (NADH-binding)